MNTRHVCTFFWHPWVYHQYCLMWAGWGASKNNNTACNGHQILFKLSKNSL